VTQKMSYVTAYFKTAHV